MTSTAGKLKPSESPTVFYGGRAYAALPEETVLDVLLRNEIEVPYSCKKGTCLSCIARTGGEVPEGARTGLRPTLIDQGYFLPCICPADGSLEILPATDEALFAPATIVSCNPLGANITRLRLRPEGPFSYRPGQFLNMRREDGLVRSYSIASIPANGADGGDIELHIKRLRGGLMSNWAAEQAAPGDRVHIQGPNGDCFYLEGEPERQMLLIGNGAGLAPLIGIIGEALRLGHKGDIHLFHGSRHLEGLYLQDEMRRLATETANFYFHPCLSGGDIPKACRTGRADDLAFSDHANLTNWRVYLCGHPPMVETARKRAFLAGARLQDILFDAFELRDLRKFPRD